MSKNSKLSKEKREAATQSPFFRKKSRQPFFSGNKSFFTSPVIETETNSNHAIQRATSRTSGNSHVQLKKKEEFSVQTKDNVDVNPTTSNQNESPGAGKYIVDDASMPDAGQMRKSDFLNQLKAEVYSTLNEVRAGMPFSPDNISYVESSFAQGKNSSPTEIESSISRFCPLCAGASNAGEVIQQIKTKVYETAKQSIRSGVDLLGLGQIFNAAGSIAGSVASGVNSAIDTVTSGISSVAGTITSDISSIADKASSGIGSAVDTISSGIDSVTDSIGSGLNSVSSGVTDLLFKENAGGATAKQSPEAVMQSLGNGQSLEGNTRSKMEHAFSENFSEVQIHTGSHAAQLSKDMNARAFTVGNHIAFGSGEHQPGTIAGDSLLAHELAHVGQQKGSSQTSSDKRIEEEADEAAVGVMAKVTTGKDVNPKVKKSKGIKTGLRLSRCKDCGTTPPQKIDDPKKYPTYDGWLVSFPPHTGLSDTEITPMAPPALQQLISPTDGGFVCDCADVSLFLRHYYLKTWDRNFTFKAGPGEGKEYTIGKGVSDSQIRQIASEIGTINFQEDRGGARDAPTSLVSFYKDKGVRVTNLKRLIDKGLKSGDLFVWDRLPSVHGNFEGHVQTVQSVDVAGQRITFVQGNMSHGVGVGQIQQRQQTFQELTGVADGNAKISDATEESFYGAGPWKA